MLPGQIALNEGGAKLTHRGREHRDRPIQVGSHYPFAEINRALLVFERAP